MSKPLWEYWLGLLGGLGQVMEQVRREWKGDKQPGYIGSWFFTLGAVEMIKGYSPG